jgi:hypothetical protein
MVKTIEHSPIFTNSPITNYCSMLFTDIEFVNDMNPVNFGLAIIKLLIVIIIIIVIIIVIIIIVIINRLINSVQPYVREYGVVYCSTV